MIRKYKIIILLGIAAISFNIAAKIFFIDPQADKILILQKVVAAARSGSYMKPGSTGPDKSAEQADLERLMGEIPEAFLFTEYAAGIRSFMDKRHLLIDGSLIFQPEKTKQTEEMGLVKYNTRIAVIGDYMKIKGFISDILTMHGLLYLNSVRINREQENQDRVRLTLELSVFFKKGTI